MKLRLSCALCLVAVLAAPAAGSPDAQPPTTGTDPPAPVPEPPPAAEPIETGRVIEEAVQSPRGQAAVGDAPAVETPSDAGAAQAPEPPPASRSSQSTEPLARPTAGSVAIRDFEFSPGRITVAAGDTVTWINGGPSEHSATSAAFDTGILLEGARGSHTFEAAGTFSYACSVHPSMNGTVEVTASDSADPEGSPRVDPETTSGGASTPGDGQTLPDTGPDLLPPAVAGLALLAAGIALFRRGGAVSPRRP